jgi:hypothetical protein
MELAQTPSMKRSFMHSISTYLRDRIIHVANERRYMHDDSLKYAEAQESGRLAELELLSKVVNDYFNNAYSSMKPTEVSFNALVSSLIDLPDDAPIKLIVQAGLGTAKPMSSINITMLDLRHFDAIQRLYQQEKE